MVASCSYGIEDPHKTKQKNNNNKTPITKKAFNTDTTTAINKQTNKQTPKCH